MQKQAFVMTDIIIIKVYLKHLTQSVSESKERQNSPPPQEIVPPRTDRGRPRKVIVQPQPQEETLPDTGPSPASMCDPILREERGYSYAAANGEESHMIIGAAIGAGTNQPSSGTRSYSMEAGSYRRSLICVWQVWLACGVMQNVTGRKCCAQKKITLLDASSQMQSAAYRRRSNSI